MFPGSTTAVDSHTLDIPSSFPQLRRRRPIGTLAGHDGSVWAVAFPRRTRTLVSAGSDGTIRIWDTDVDNSAGRIRRALGTPADHTP
ncbi:WD40 repeat domain-containing protein [Embleya sp. NPDC050493]|uniref:WD40 repeat domain-containing protein n=1 Tax=Embleya sp. NPDC050493 TaxID=3363989 RepID=UPI0037A22274